MTPILYNLRLHAGDKSWGKGGGLNALGPLAMISESNKSNKKEAMPAIITLFSAARDRSSRVPATLMGGADPYKPSGCASVREYACFC